MTIDARFHIARGDFKLAAEFSVPAAGVTAVFGPSGCGKTTLLRAIAGLEQHAGGYLKVGEMVWQEDARFIPPHQRPLGYVFQEASLFEHLNVWRNLEYGIKRVPEAERRVSLDRAIELLGIGPLLQRKPETLSGGERQRVAIARALAVSPRLLLMDEPLAALDENRKQEILPYIESLHEELDIPVIYVSHSADEVARLADHLVLLEAGSVAATGAISDMLTRLDLSLAHGSDAEALIEATVAAHDDEYDLTYVEFSGGRFTVPRKDLPLGNAVRLRVAARDVSLTLEHQTNTSILNIFPAIVDALTDEQAAQVTVRLLVGDVPMLARVTRKSATLLELRPGRKVYAQAKSVALLS
ncbi:MAG: molybdenum ABC transporter ATP-binding protein [Gammaproteobacteria bacterium]|nr:molybdenum ABC transporter ATP-binding protein [Gammaproteobacteria bacterium]